jgi:hypothetical protein
MGQTATVSTAIIDSTLVGRELITAADEAAARLSLELSATDDVTFNSVSAVDGDFSGIVSIGAYDIDVFATKIARFSYGGSSILELISDGRMYTRTSIGTSSLGLDTLPWGNVYSVNGSFAGNLNVEVGGTQRVYNLGRYPDADTEYLETSWDTNEATILSKSTGAGAGRTLIVGAGNTYVSCAYNSTLTLYHGGSRAFRAENSATYMYYGGTKLLKLTAGVVGTDTDNTVSLGTDAVRWSDVYSVDGDFSGELTAPTVRGITRFKNAASNWIDIDGAITASNIASISSRFSLTVSAVAGVLKLKGSAGVELQHDSNGTKLSTTTTGVSVDGNLNTEVGGSQRVYNLGTEGDTDSEFLETSWTANSALIASKATGTGVLREIAIGSDSCKFESRPATNQATIRTDSLPRMVFLGGITRVWNTTQFSPQTNAATLLGNASSRWSNVYSVAGNFSGNVIMAANVDFTGLPTADPVVAGRLWNDGGTMKISAG